MAHRSRHSRVPRRRSPLGVGFDAYASIKGKTISVGSFAFPAGAEPGWQFIGWVYHRPEDGPVDLIMRSSSAAGMESIDAYDVWQGTLIFKNEPIH